MRNRTALALSTLLLAAAPALAGVVYEIEVKDHEQSPPKTESIQAAVEGRHLKMGIAGGTTGKGRAEMIYKGDKREMVVVDHDGKTYMVLDQDAIAAIAGQVGNAMRQMQEALKNVPEDRRAMVEEMMKKRMPQAVEKPRSRFEKTGERATHNGYPCVKYVVWNADRKTRELWVTDWGNIEGGTEIAGTFKDMAGFFREMMDSFTQASGPGVPGAADFGDNMFKDLEEIDGFPVVTREFDDDGSLEGESALRSAKRQTLDPDAFEPPSGYKRQEMFGGR